MKIETSIIAASGLTFDRCAVLILRSPERFDGTDCESFVARGTTKGLELDTALPGWVKGIRRLNDGTIFAVGEGGIHVGRSPIGAKSAWTSFKTEFSPRGVWGLRSDFVLAFGDECVEVEDDTDFRGRCLLWEGGERWREFESPGYGVLAMAGLGPEVIYAVGVEGLVARWDGRTWTRLVVPDAGFMCGLCVVNADEMYAVSAEGSIFEGSQYGWVFVTNVGRSLSAVTKFGRRVLVSSPSLGIHELVGRDLVPVEPGVKGRLFDTRGQLLVTTEDSVAASGDGRSFRVGMDLEQVASLLPPRAKDQPVVPEDDNLEE